ncbi:hypothetical protein Pcinc_042898, partial [Petrolisthes cinctipes]
MQPQPPSTAATDKRAELDIGKVGCVTMLRDVLLGLRKLLPESPAFVFPRICNGGRRSRVLTPCPPG